MSPKSYFEVAHALPGGGKRIRFESLDLKEAEGFAGRVYRREKIIAMIHEVPRS